MLQITKSEDSGPTISLMNRMITIHVKTAINPTIHLYDIASPADQHNNYRGAGIRAPHVEQIRVNDPPHCGCHLKLLPKCVY